MALTAEEDEAPVWKIPGTPAPGTRPRLLLTSPETLGRGPDVRRKRIEELAQLARSEPTRLVAWLGDEHTSLRLPDATEFASAVGRRLARAPSLAPQTPTEAEEAPTASREETTAEARHAPPEDDTATPGMGA
jgi:hypothetical protein